MEAFTITTDFPGGNVTVLGEEGDEVKLAADNRDSKPWFYWNFAVKEAAGRTLQFVFAPGQVGVRGPGVSLDQGKTWKWMGADAVTAGTFSYTFPAEAKEVRFSNGMPYVNSDFQRFIETFKGNPNVRLEVLTQTPKGRDVPLVKIGKPGARYAMAIACRHHASEMVGSYVMEGIVQGILADDSEGKWLRENVEFFIVPFADFDGVEDGDQGKNRAPHDHNRDYAGAPLYTEVAAIKEQLPVWAANRPLIFFDIHNPALKGDFHEFIQILDGDDPTMSGRLERLMAAIDVNQQGTVYFRQNLIMKFGSGFNTIKGVPPPYSAGWARTLPNIFMGITLEMPFANASGSEVNSTSSREFGRDIAWGLKAFLEKESSTPTQ